MTHARTLPDIQRTADSRGIDIQTVGIKGYRVPLSIMQKDGLLQQVVALATVGVGLPHSNKGTHMSRFISQLAEWAKGKTLKLDLKAFLEECMERLDSSSAHSELEFGYFIEKAAPVSKLVAPMEYSCSLAGTGQKNGKGEFFETVVGVRVPVSTLCPCSKAISDYGAHNQRAEIRAEVIVSTEAEKFYLEDLIIALEECGSCPVFPLLKREDEKYVTERQFDNPKFVEDVIRDGTATLREFPGIKGFSIEVEALESIHGHNAWTSHREKY